MTNTTIQTVSNADVVAIKGRAAIMRQAWFLLKSVGVTSFSKALCKAWANLRAAIALDRKLAPVTVAVKAKQAKTDKHNATRAALLESRQASYTGDRSSRSPLNPFAVRSDLTGWEGRACIATQLGR